MSQMKTFGVQNGKSTTKSIKIVTLKIMKFFSQHEPETEVNELASIYFRGQSLFLSHGIGFRGGNPNL
jgi:hypothetical protein